tara:strand:- start:185 stop:415 length:231 start_codon:yes stop_codon:yes gene_type:complete
MKDERLQILIDQTIKQKLKFFALVDKLENEYERRFGNKPSDVDDDNFIDTFHMRQGNEMTVFELTEKAKNCKERRN